MTKTQTTQTTQTIQVRQIDSQPSTLLAEKIEIIANPQIFTSEFGMMLVERHSRGLFSAACNTHSVAGGSAKSVVERLVEILKNERQINLENF